MMRIVLLLSAITGLLLIGCSSSSTTDALAPGDPEVQADAELGILKEWAGVGVQTTEPFSIETASWAVSLTNIPVILKGQSLGSLKIMVYDADNRTAPVAVFNYNEKGSDIYYLEGAGDFYLEINSANTRWAVKVLVSQ